MVLTLHMCVLYRSQKKTATFALYSNRLVGYNGDRRWMMCSVINLPESTVLIRCCRKLAKNDISLWQSVSLSVLLCVRPSCPHATTRTGRIYTKYDIWGFFENL